MITNDYHSKSTVTTQREKTQKKAEENLKKANEKQAKVTHFVTDPSYKARRKVLDGHPISLKRVLI